MSKALTADDKRELGKLEDRITKSQAFDLDACDALLEIYRQGLYRHRYSNFNQYCTVRWDMRGEVAKDWIRASLAMSALAEGSVYPKLPTSVSQARALTIGLYIIQTHHGFDFSFTDKAGIRELWEGLLRDRGASITKDAIEQAARKTRRSLAPSPGTQVSHAVIGVYIRAGSPADSIAQQLSSILTSTQMKDLIIELVGVSAGQFKEAA